MPDQKPTVGRIVHFAPPQKCVGPASLTLYPAIITQVFTLHEVEQRSDEILVDLVTFGPNSIYFQHSISFSPEPKAGCWFWPARV